MIEISLKEIISAIDGKSLSAKRYNKDFSISSISIDSRTVVEPGSCLFFAIKGERHNGHTYIEDLYKKGMQSFVISNKTVKYEMFPKAHFIGVPDTLSALQSLAAWYRQKFKYPIMGITGSNGKTIVKEWLFELLADRKVIRSPKSYNSQVGVPLSIFNMDDQYDLGIFEAGISKPGEMEQLAKIISPDYGIFTNIGDAHQKNFDTLDQKIAEKLELFKTCKLLVYNSDNEMISEQVKRKFNNSGKKLLGWSLKDKKAELYFNIKIENGTYFRFQYDGKLSEAKIPFQDAAHIENAAHCLAFIISQKAFNQQVARAFGELSPIAMRLELKQGINNCSLINDYYNSDINSLEIALHFLNQQTASSDRKKTVILSDIQQTGLETKKLAVRISQLLTQQKIDRFFGIGISFKNYSGLFKNARFFENTDSFLSELDHSEFSDENILIKGARNFHFERISSVLQKKHNETILEIRLHEMVENLNAFRVLLESRTKLMVMVKAFSYGSGTIEVARTLQFQKVDYLAVALADEGIELRQAGIYLPIVVMNPEPHSFEAMIEFQLEPNIYSRKLFIEFEKVAKRTASRKYPIHLKIDTGMHRLGFVDSNDFEQVINNIASSGTLRLKTAFSHLAASDEKAHDSFTLEQIRQFKSFAEIIKRKLSYDVEYHILNSAGIERFPEFQHDIVRLGIGLYGISVSSKINCLPVAHWLTSVSQVQKVDAGETIGYSRKAKVNSPKQVAIIPVGYADGYNRHLGNGQAKVWLAKQEIEVPTIGNICMDMSMIDVTGLGVQAGDPVELMGKNIRLFRLAKWADTIPYEILTGISLRVKRIYVME